MTVISEKSQGAGREGKVKKGKRKEKLSGLHPSQSEVLGELEKGSGKKNYETHTCRTCRLV